MTARLHDRHEDCNKNKGKPKKTWSQEAINDMLGLVQEMGLLSQLDAKRQRNKPIYQSIQKELNDMGHDFDWDEINNQWKYLKKQYYKVKQRLLKSGQSGEGRQWKPFPLMDTLLGKRPRTQALISAGLQSFPLPPERSHDTGEGEVDQSEGNVDQPPENVDSSAASEQESIVLVVVGEEEPNLSLSEASQAPQSIPTTPGSSTASPSYDHAEPSTTPVSGISTSRACKKRKRSSGDSFEDKLLAMMEEENNRKREELQAIHEDGENDRRLFQEGVSAFVRLTNTLLQKWA